DGSKVELSVLLACGAHRRQRGRRVAFDHAVSVPDLGVHPIASGYAHELLDCGAERGLDLLPRILQEALRHDRTHFAVEVLETAEPIEYAAAPEEIVASRRKLIAMGAQPQTRIRAMVVQIAGDDTGLQHAAEQDRVSTRRPTDAARHGIVGSKEHRAAQEEGGEAAAE